MINPMMFVSELATNMMNYEKEKENNEMLVSKYIGNNSGYAEYELTNAVGYLGSIEKEQNCYKLTFDDFEL